MIDRVDRPVEQLIDEILVMDCQSGSAKQTKHQIMYAVIFGLFVEGIALMKIFAWQMLARNSVKREIKRLELRIAELNEAVKSR